jgi:transposase
MIPRDLLPWDAAYRWYRAWTGGGTWDRIHDALRGQVRAAAGRDPAPSAGVARRLVRPDKSGRPELRV